MNKHRETKYNNQKKKLILNPSGKTRFNAFCTVNYQKHSKI